MFHAFTDPSSVKARIAAAGAACHAALAAESETLLAAVPALPGTAERCFAFLNGLGYSTGSNSKLACWTREAGARGIAAPHAVERYLTLQAATIALARLDALPVHADMKRHLCATIDLVASPEGKTDSRLSYRHDAFAELARLVTLRRFHGGQFSFDIARIGLGALAAWTLSLHPRDLPRWMRELIGGAGIFTPALSPHLCYWRPRSGPIAAKEQVASLLSAAKTMALHPKVRALVGASWLLSPDVGASFSHLSFVRDLFVENGAYAVDLGPARPTDGYLTGSARRRRLYEDGKFSPQKSCVIWRRAAFLAWAADTEAAPSDAGPVGEIARPESTTHARRADRSAGRQNWTRGRKLLFDRPKLYAATIVVAPALAGATLAGHAFGLAFAFPGFLLAATAMWLFQSFVLLRCGAFNRRRMR